MARDEGTGRIRVAVGVMVRVTLRIAHLVLEYVKQFIVVYIPWVPHISLGD